MSVSFDPNSSLNQGFVTNLPSSTTGLGTTGIGQPFSYGGPSAGGVAMPGQISPYFSGGSSPGMDVYQSPSLFGTPNASNNASSMDGATQTLPAQTILARFQAMSDRLDTQMTPNADHIISTDDINEALKDKSGKYSDQDKQVLQLMVDNVGGMRGKLDGLDGKDDGAIHTDNINAMMIDPNNTPDSAKKAEDKMSNTEAVGILADYMGTAIHNGHSDKYVDKHGKLVASQRGAWSTDRNKLTKLAKDEEVPEEVRTAAKKLLASKELFKKVDTAHKHGKPDGRISIKDLQSAGNDEDLDSIGKTSANTTVAGMPGYGGYGYGSYGFGTLGTTGMTSPTGTTDTTEDSKH